MPYQKYQGSPIVVRCKLVKTLGASIQKWSALPDLWQTLLILDDARSPVSSYSFSPISHIPTKKEREVRILKMAPQRPGKPESTH